MEVLQLLGPSAIIAIGTIVAAVVQARAADKQAKRKRTAAPDHVTRIALISTTGILLTVFAIGFALSNSQNSIEDRL